MSTAPIVAGHLHHDRARAARAQGEGYGFIPNIGMRGLDPNRSQKLPVLEHGVPVAPGLFLANKSYYSPRV